MSKVKIAGIEIFSHGFCYPPDAPRNVGVLLRYSEPEDGDLCQDLKKALYEDESHSYRKPKAPVYLTTDPRIIKAHQMVEALEQK